MHESCCTKRILPRSGLTFTRKDQHQTVRYCFNEDERSGSGIGLSGETNGHLDAFTFRTDGLFFDPQHHACVLMGTAEFASFWHAFDGCFSSPLGRKLIYAATEARKPCCASAEDFQYGRWFGRRPHSANLRQRSHRMGGAGLRTSTFSCPPTMPSPLVCFWPTVNTRKAAVQPRVESTYIRAH